MERALDGEVHSGLTSAISRETSVTVNGVLGDDPQTGRFETDAFVRVPVGHGHRTLLAVATGDDAVRLRVLEAGDRVVLSGRLGPLRAAASTTGAAGARGRPARPRQAACAVARGTVAFANRLRDVVIREPRRCARRRARCFRASCSATPARFPTTWLPCTAIRGLSHLLVVSGENVAFTLALFGPLLRRLPLGARTIGALVIVLLFATMTRFEPSVLRASALAVVALGSSFVGRPASSLRRLVLAVIALLVIDPFLVHSVAFWLSCGASAGIATLSAPIRGACASRPGCAIRSRCRWPRRSA